MLKFIFIFFFSAVLMLPAAHAQKTCQGEAPGSPSGNKILRKLNDMSDYLFSKSKKAVSHQVNKSEFLVGSGNDFQRAAKFTGREILKLIRKNGVKLKVKVPLEDIYIQEGFDLLLEKIGLGNLVDHAQVKLEFRYEIEIEPDFRNGHIYRHDTFSISPKMSYNNVVKSLDISGSIGTSYILTHSRRYDGHKEEDNHVLDEDSDEYLAPIKKVLETRSIFFEPKCDLSTLEYIPKMINLPFSYDEMDQQLQDGDKLTYEKKSILSGGFGVSNIDNFLRAHAGVKKPRIVSLNLIAEKNKLASNSYSIKAFLDTEDVLAFGTGVKTSLAELDRIGFKQLDKLLKKPFRKKLVEVAIGTRQKVNYLSTFILSFDNPKFTGNKEIMDSVHGPGGAKEIYDNFIINNLNPQWHHIPEAFKMLVSFDSHNDRKEKLRNQLRDLVMPLIYASKKSQEVIAKTSVEVDTFIGPGCETEKIYPFTHYFTSIQDMTEPFEVLHFSLPYLFTVGLEKSKPIKYYEIFDDRTGEWQFPVESVNKTKFLVELPFTLQGDWIPKVVLAPRSTLTRQAYLLADATPNRGIKSLRTLGFDFALRDSDFISGKVIDRDFEKVRNEISNIVPEGPFRDRVVTELGRFKNSSSVFIGYNYMFNATAFDQLQKKITTDVISRISNNSKTGKIKINDPFAYIRGLLDKCLTEKDPNYGGRVACNFLNDPDLYEYKKSLRSPPSRASSDFFTIKRRETFDKVDEHLDEIAKMLTLTLLYPPDSDGEVPTDTFGTYSAERDKKYYELIDAMGKKVQRALYEVKGWGPFTKVSNKKRDTSVNNAKLALFESIAGSEYFSKRRTSSGSYNTFSKIAPVFFMYLLNYSLEGSDYTRNIINRDNIEKFVSFEAYFKSAELGIESPPDLKFGEPDPATKRIQSLLRRFGRHLKTIDGREYSCHSEDGRSGAEKQLNAIDQTLDQTQRYNEYLNFIEKGPEHFDELEEEKAEALRQLEREEDILLTE